MAHSFGRRNHVLRRLMLSLANRRFAVVLNAIRQSRRRRDDPQLRTKSPTRDADKVRYELRIALASRALRWRFHCKHCAAVLCRLSMNRDLWQRIPTSHRRHSPLKRKHVIPGDMGGFGIQDKREMALHKRRMHIAAVVVSVGVCPQIVTPPRAGSGFCCRRSRKVKRWMPPVRTRWLRFCNGRNSMKVFQRGCRKGFRWPTKPGKLQKSITMRRLCLRNGHLFW